MRLDVKKTYKLFIGGAFPRSESGRSYEIKNKRGQFIANPAQASRKDLRDAVLAAKNAHPGWSGATAFNRGQILYRIAEMLEGRTSQFVDEIVATTGVTSSVAKQEVSAAIDRWVWYAGWCDKITSVSGNNNPIAGPYYNFTIPESLGVIGIVAEEKDSLIGLVRSLAPIIAGGNTSVLIASQSRPLAAVTLAEVLATSDLPAGVVNILTGIKTELAPWLASHMEIDGLDLSGIDSIAELRVSGAENLKRIHTFEKDVSPERILAFMEYKTIWHPVGI
ncbi:MAG: aldehyde dehydrogenase family protein [Actinomycetales bacterium]|nr:aldehyde dehydrogenase family protein [Actinomycetales bacterium]